MERIKRLPSNNNGELDPDDVKTLTKRLVRQYGDCANLIVLQANLQSAKNGTAGSDRQVHWEFVVP